MSYSQNPNEVEIEQRCYCADNGYFCRYLDKASGLCIATSCKHAQELLRSAEIERQAKAKEELTDGYLELQAELYERAITEIAVYGATMIDLDISEGDLNDFERSWATIHRPTEQDRRSRRKSSDITQID